MMLTRTIQYRPIDAPHLAAKERHRSSDLLHGAVDPDFGSWEKG
jgi:hypothetical protein